MYQEKKKPPQKAQNRHKKASHLASKTARFRPSRSQDLILPQSPLWTKCQDTGHPRGTPSQSTPAKRASCSPALPCPTLAALVDGAHQDTGHRAKIKVKSTVKIRAKGNHSTIIKWSDALHFNLRLKVRPAGG